jgi:hypothetical protein
MEFKLNGVPTNLKIQATTGIDRMAEILATLPDGELFTRKEASAKLGVSTSHFSHITTHEKLAKFRLNHSVYLLWGNENTVKKAKEELGLCQ